MGERTVGSSATSEVKTWAPEPHEDSPELVEAEIAEPVDVAAEHARRVGETTRAAGCYVLGRDLPARNPRLPTE